MAKINVSKENFLFAHCIPNRKKHKSLVDFIFCNLSNMLIDLKEYI